MIFLLEEEILLHRPCIKSTLLEYLYYQDVLKDRLMVSSQVWVPTIFILGLPVTIPWYFAAHPVSLGYTFKTRLCLVWP